MEEDPVVAERRELGRTESESGGKWRRADILQIAALALVITLLSSVFMAAFAWRTRAWQLGAVSAWLLFGAMIAGMALRLARRQRTDQAISLVLALLLVLLPGLVCFLASARWALGLGVLFYCTLYVGLVSPPVQIGRRMLITVAVSAATIVLDSLVPWPWERLDVTQYGPITAFSYVIVVVSVLLAVIELGRAYQRITTIRTRLTVSFVLAVLLVAAAISVTSVLLGFYSARQQTFDRLELAVTLKRDAIDTWVENLRLDLGVVARGEGSSALVALTQSDQANDLQRLEENLQDRLVDLVRQEQRFEQVFLLDAKGRVVLSTEQGREGQSAADQTYYQRGLLSSYVQPPTYVDELARVVVYASHPVRNSEGESIGVWVGRANLAQLNEVLTLRTAMGQTGETYAVAADRRLLTELRTDYPGTHLNTDGVRTAISDRRAGRAIYENYWAIPVLGVYTWVPELELGLLGEMELGEATRDAQLTFLVNGGVALLAAAIAVGFSLVIARSIAAPLSALAETAAQIAAGELALVAQVEREDEIGTLARTFNAMTGQLRELIDSLEDRVLERTRGLQAAAQVSRMTHSVLDPAALQRNVVDLVRERFDLYYVGLFVVNVEGRYAELAAGTGDAGRQMLVQGHRLEIGGASMIGRCVAGDRSLVQQEEGDERIRYANPMLPETRSELAVPLRARGRVIGAMTVQSKREGAFDETTISVLQTLADQVAVSMDNARLFAETQAALTEAEEVHRRYLGQAWQQYLRETSIPGYRYTPGGGVVGVEPEALDRDLWPVAESAVREQKPIVFDGTVSSKADSGAIEHAEAGQSSVLVAPVTQAGQVVAALGFERDTGNWSSEQIALVEAIAEQLGLAMDNQRLLDATQSRAARDRIVTELTERLSSTLDMDAVLETAAREIGSRLDLEYLSLNIKSGSGAAGSAGILTETS